MKKMIFTLLFTLAATTTLFATDIDIYFGQYSGNNDGFPLSFRLSIDGVDRLMVDGRAVDRASVEYAFLGVYGDSEIFRIEYTDDDGHLNVIKLFIVDNENRVLLATGYYVRSYMKSSTEPVEIKNITPITLHFEPEEM